MSTAKDELLAKMLDQYDWLADFEVEGEEEVEEVTYEDVFEDGTEVNSMQKSLTDLEPGNKLEELLLSVVPGTKRFSDTKVRNRWRRLEDKARPNKQGREFLAWLIFCINWGKEKNQGVVRIKVINVVSMAEREDAFRQFQVDYQNRIAKTPAPEASRDAEKQEQALNDLYS